jgi:hypothetical protein
VAVPPASLGDARGEPEGDGVPPPSGVGVPPPDALPEGEPLGVAEGVAQNVGETVPSRGEGEPEGDPDEVAHWLPLTVALPVPQALVVGDAEAVVRRGSDGVGDTELQGEGASEALPTPVGEPVLVGDPRCESVSEALPVTLCDARVVALSHAVLLHVGLSVPAAPAEDVADAEGDPEGLPPSLGEDMSDIDAPREFVAAGERLTPALLAVGAPVEVAGALPVRGALEDAVTLAQPDALPTLLVVLLALAQGVERSEEDTLGGAEGVPPSPEGEGVGVGDPEGVPVPRAVDDARAVAVVDGPVGLQVEDAVALPNAVALDEGGAEPVPPSCVALADEEAHPETLLERAPLTEAREDGEALLEVEGERVGDWECREEREGGELRLSLRDAAGERDAELQKETREEGEGDGEADAHAVIAKGVPVGAPTVGDTDAESQGVTECVG